MSSGFILLFVGLIPLAFIIAFSALELGIAFIQAQVFVVLTCSYIKDVLELHQEQVDSKRSTSLEWVLTNPPKPHAFISLPVQSNIFSWFIKKNIKNLIIRALIIFFTGLILRSLILYVSDLNVFLHPFNTISLIYYAFMVMYTVIQCELYPTGMATGMATGVATEVATEVPIKVEAPMEAPIAAPMGVPMAMVQDTNPIYFAMNNTNSAPQGNNATEASSSTGGANDSTGANDPLYNYPIGSDNPLDPNNSVAQDTTQLSTSNPVRCIYDFLSKHAIQARSSDKLPITAYGTPPVNGRVIITGYIDIGTARYVPFAGNSHTGQHACVHVDTGDIYAWGGNSAWVIYPNPYRYRTGAPSENYLPTILVNRPITQVEIDSLKSLNMRHVRPAELPLRPDVRTRLLRLKNPLPKPMIQLYPVNQNNTLVPWTYHRPAHYKVNNNGG